jgi:hypothetical protein
LAVNRFAPETPAVGISRCKSDAAGDTRDPASALTRDCSNATIGFDRRKVHSTLSTLPHLLAETTADNAV